MNSIAAHLNQLSPVERAEALTRCCASSKWVDQMQGDAPYQDDNQLLAAAGAVWSRLGREDWLQAFAAHPRIGDVESLRAKYAATKQWATGEQSGVAGASEATIARLAEQNAAYEQRFGFLFIVCATGKTADEMLGLLELRIHNQPEEELKIAAAEQLKITLLRLRKLGE